MTLTPQEIAKIRQASGLKPLNPDGSVQVSLVDRLPALKQQPVAQSQEPSLLSRIGSDIKSAGSEVNNQITGNLNDSPVVRGFKATEAAFGAVPKVASEFLPKPARDVLDTVGEKAGGVISWLADKIGSTEAAQQWVKDHPDAANNLEKIATIGQSSGNISNVILGAEAAGRVAPKAVEAAKSIEKVIPELNAGKAGIDPLAEALTPSKQGSKAFNEAVDISRPKLSPLEKEAALKEGRVKTEGILGKKTVTPTAAEQRAAEAIQPLVEDGRISLKNSPEKNIDEISTEVSRINQDVGNFIADNKVPFNEKQLRAKLDASKAENSLIFASEPTAEKTYNAVIDEFLKYVRNKDTKGLFEARQGFDKVPAIRKLLENEKFGENVKRQIVLDVREAVNSYVADLLPGESGALYRNALKRETNMLRAVDNIAQANRGIIDTNAISRLFKKHPVLKTLIPTGLAGTALGTVILK